MPYLALIRRFWWALPIVALLAWGLRVDYLRGVYKSRWQTITTEYAAFKVAIIDKTAEALAVQKAINAAQEKEWKDRADATDKAHEQAMDDAMARADRHIAANRVLRQAGGESATRGTCAAAQDDGPRGTDGAGGEAELVAVTAEDVRVCTVNTQRLQDVHDWAVGIDGGNR